MNIINYFSAITTCRDCVNGMLHDSGMVLCKKAPMFSQVNRGFVGYGITLPENRCDNGMWYLAIDNGPPRISNTEHWILSPSWSKRRARVVPREDWPDIEDTESRD